MGRGNPSTVTACVAKELLFWLNGLYGISAALTAAPKFCRAVTADVPRKGLKLQYFDLVEGSEIVCQMLCDLSEYSAHRDISDRFIFDLIDFGADSIKAAWLLALLRARNDVYHPPPTQRLELASVDYTLLRSAYDLAQANEEIRDCSPTYWRDTVAELGFG